ncbi:hypothetical protein [Nocardia farcinica]|uniref:hypothetical protein n=1 Tax=Nocardia farcinica TaxID=37329 RepID=UPI0003252BCA|nr:hypothetical protein [Nocardia farcinica]
MSRWWSLAKDWWFNFHQRGIFAHCPGTFWWCVIDNVVHGWPFLIETVDEDGGYPGEHWVCRRHEEAVVRAYMRSEHGDRARAIRRLGWGR